MFGHPVMKRHLYFWLILMVIGVFNGILRVFTYGRLMTDLTAHQLSTVTGIILSGFAGWILWKYRPLETAHQAWIVGIVWFSMTIAFEFGFGHYIAGHSWQHLLADYNLLRGRVWSLFLVWILIMPYFFFRISKQAE
jgi:hypothetical protein